MVVKLKSALKNPVSPLLAKALALAVLIFWLREDGISAFKFIVFLLAAIAFYLKPAINAGKFVVSAFVLVLLVLLAPQVAGLMGFYVNLILATLGFMLLGVKNLIFIKRQTTYYALHLVLLVGLASLFSLGVMTQVKLFAILIVLLREFYLTIAPEKPNLIGFVAALEAMLLLQVAWVTSFFPTSFLVNASFLVLTAFVFHDSLIHHFRETFDRKIAIRNGALFVTMTLLILIMPVWGFQ